MTTLSLRDAAEQTGVSKSTIFRAIKAGRMSAPRDGDGNFAIDPAELFRVYPPKAVDAPDLGNQGDVPAQAETRAEGQGAPAHDTVELRIRNAALEAEVAGLRAMAEELRLTRDQWQQQAERATLMLGKPETVPGRNGSWWPFRRAS